MDKENRPYFADEHPSGGGPVDKAKLQIIRFVVGEDMDPQKMTEAVDHLRRAAPAELEALHNQLAKSEEELCSQVSDCLEDYLELADEASARMPEVHRHLQACARCSSELALLQEASELRDDWLMFSDELRSRSAAPNWLALVQRGWQWLTAEQEPIEMGRVDSSGEIRMGSFSVRLAAAGAYHLSGGFQPATAQLSTLARTDAPRIDLEITPKRFETAHTYEWVFRARLHEDSPIPSTFVSIGHPGQQSSSTLELRQGRLIEFRLPPPTKESYWLFIEWESPADEWHTEGIEIPVLDNLNG